MTLRKFMLWVVISFICYEIHVAVQGDKSDIVDHLVLGLMLVVMLPAERVDKEWVEKLFDKWTNRNKGDE